MPVLLVVLVAMVVVVALAAVLFRAGLRNGDRPGDPLTRVTLTPGPDGSSMVHVDVTNVGDVPVPVAVRVRPAGQVFGFLAGVRSATEVRTANRTASARYRADRFDALAVVEGPGRSLMSVPTSGHRAQVEVVLGLAGQRLQVREHFVVLTDRRGPRLTAA